MHQKVIIPTVERRLSIKQFKPDWGFAYQVERSWNRTSWELAGGLRGFGISGICISIRYHYASIFKNGERKTYMKENDRIKTRYVRSARVCIAYYVSIYIYMWLSTQPKFNKREGVCNIEELNVSQWQIHRVVFRIGINVVRLRRISYWLQFLPIVGAVDPFWDWYVE